jgi:hypothetical protein
LGHGAALSAAGHEASRIHHAALCCGDDLAARGAPAAAGDASDRVSSVLHRLTQTWTVCAHCVSDDAETRSSHTPGLAIEPRVPQNCMRTYPPVISIPGRVFVRRSYLAVLRMGQSSALIRYATEHKARNTAKRSTETIGYDIRCANSL